MSSSGPGLDALKREARRTLRQLRSSIKAAERVSAEAVIVQLLDAHLDESRCVGLYAASSSEVSLDLLAKLLSARDIALAWPRVEGQSLRLYRATIEELAPGYRGLREPPPSAPEVSLGDLDTLLVPGVGFDREGRRLGQGGGFYDRLLAKHPVSTIGVAFEVQLHAQLPAGSHDQTMDLLVTEQGLVWPGR